MSELKETKKEKETTKKEKEKDTLNETEKKDWNKLRAEKINSLTLNFDKIDADTQSMIIKKGASRLIDELNNTAELKRQAIKEQKISLEKRKTQSKTAQLNDLYNLLLETDDFNKMKETKAEIIKLKEEIKKEREARKKKKDK